jgi:hypothetical protein
MTRRRAIFALFAGLATATLFGAAIPQPAEAQSRSYCAPSSPAKACQQRAARDGDTRFGYRSYPSRRNSGAVRSPYRRTACSNGCRRGCRRILYSCRGNRASCRARFQACMRRCGC